MTSLSFSEFFFNVGIEGSYLFITSSFFAHSRPLNCRIHCILSYMMTYLQGFSVIKTISRLIDNKINCGTMEQWKIDEVQDERLFLQLIRNRFVDAHI